MGKNMFLARVGWAALVGGLLQAGRTVIDKGFTSNKISTQF